MRKKGFNKNLLVGIGILLAGIIVATSLILGQAKVNKNPIGTAQIAILLAANHADDALLYLDLSSGIAVDISREEFEDSGGMFLDHEEESYPCGEVLGVPYWNNKTHKCIPDLKAEYDRLLRKNLGNLLEKHPSITFPTSFDTSYTSLERGTLVRGESIVPLVIDFYGGGKIGYSQKESSFQPDYPAASTPTTLSYLSRSGRDIEHIVTHYTVTRSVSYTIDVLRGNGLSYHYLIDKDGSVVQLVPESLSAQHAYCGSDQEGCVMPNMNSKSIGISFINCGYDKSCQASPKTCAPGYDQCWEPYTQSQLEAFTWLVADIASRNPTLLQDGQITDETLIMHSDVRTGKVDPGPIFASRKSDLLSSINAQIRRPAQVAGSAIRNPGAVTEERLSEYESLIQTAALKNELDPAIIKAIISQESSAQPELIGGGNDLGLMQIVPFKTTGEMVNHNFCVNSGCGFSAGDTIDEVRDDYLDPAKNICCGSAFFRAKIDQGSPPLECSGETVVFTMPYEWALRRYNGVACNDYVEKVMGYYEYYGGNPAQIAVPGDGYDGEYSIPLSFEQEIDLDLSALDNVIETVNTIIDECDDDTKNCTRRLAREYTAENSLSLGECSQWPFIVQFMRQYSTCYDNADGLCSIRFKNMPEIDGPTIQRTDANAFMFMLEGNEMWLTDSEGSERVFLGDEKLNKFMWNDEHREGKIEFSFGDEYHDELYLTEAIDRQVIYFGRPHTEATRPATDAIINFRREDGYFTYLPQELEEAEPLVPSTYYMCLQGRGINVFTFALYLKDKIPPSTQLSANYSESKGYLLQWEPVTHYPDGEEVSDIQEYRIYCHNESFDEPTRELFAKGVIHEEELFDPQEYSQYSSITFPLDSCVDVEMEGQLFFALETVDAQNQSTGVTFANANTFTMLPVPLPLPVTSLPDSLVWYTPS